MELILSVGVLAFFAVRSHRRRRRSTTEQGPVGWTGTTRWGSVLPLARAENRRFLRHLAFVTGVVLTPVMMLASVSAEEHWRDLSTGIALALVPLGWMTIIATNLLTLRPQRTGTDELWATLPLPQPVRTAAVLSSMLTASAFAAVLAVGFVVFQLGDPKLIGSPRWPEIAAGVVIVAGSVTVGVAVARWLPHPALGVVAVFVTSFIQARFFDTATWPWNGSESDPARFLGFLGSPTAVDDPTLELRPALWHLVYLLALVALMAGVALARDGVPRVLASGLAVAVALVAVAGWVQTRPPTEAQIARMVSYLSEPEAHQICETTGPTRYCGYPASSPDFDEWRRPVEAVRALLPPVVATRELVVQDRVPTVIGNSNCGAQRYAEGLPTAVAARIEPERVWPADDRVHPGTDRFPCGGKPVHGLFLAVQVGSWAVGLPPSPHHLDERCHADGAARAVVALWLGAAATPDGARLLDDLITEAGGDGDLDFAGWNDPPMWGVRFTTDDARTARQLLDRPTETVEQYLADNWALITDRRTPSSALAAFDAGLTGRSTVGSFAPVCP